MIRFIFIFLCLCLTSHMCCAVGVRTIQTHAAKLTEDAINALKQATYRTRGVVAEGSAEGVSASITKASNFQPQYRARFTDGTEFLMLDSQNRPADDFVQAMTQLEGVAPAGRLSSVGIQAIDIHRMQIRGLHYGATRTAKKSASVHASTLRRVAQVDLADNAGALDDVRLAEVQRVTALQGRERVTALRELASDVVAHQSRTGGSATKKEAKKFAKQAEQLMRNILHDLKGEIGESHEWKRAVKQSKGASRKVLKTPKS